MADPTRDFEYAHPGDDLTRTVAPTLASGVQADGDYLPANLGDDDPAHPFKSDSTKVRLLWDFGVATVVKYMLLVHHNFAPGLGGVVLAMGSTTATSSFSREFTIRDYFASGQGDEFPVNEHLDVRDVLPSYRYLSLELTTDNVVPVALGLCPVLTEVRALDGNLLLDGDPEEDELHPVEEHKTDAGVSTIYVHGTRLRWLRGDKLAASSDGPAIRRLNRATNGRGLPFVVMPHLLDESLAESSPDAEQEESMVVRWERTGLPRRFVGPDLLSRYRLEFEEVSRGLKPTPSAV